MEKAFPSLTLCPCASWPACARFAPSCLSAAGPVIPDRSRVWGEETGQDNALQQKLEELNVSPMLCVGVGHSGIFSSHLPFALSDPGEAKPLDGHGGAALGL